MQTTGEAFDRAVEQLVLVPGREAVGFLSLDSPVLQAMLSGDATGLGGKLEVVQLHGGASASCTGWAVDTLLPGGGVGPVTILLSVDAAPVASVLATVDRPDLPKAGVAPNAAHGFSVALPAAAARALQGPGRHVLTAKAIGSPSCSFPRPLPETSQLCVCDGKLCAC